MVIGNQDTGGTNNGSHPSGIPQDQIDNIMSGIANTGDVKMNNHRKKLRQRFDIIKKLGQGTYGKVQLGINKETGQEVAIKTIKKCKIEAEADLVRIRREVQIMSSVQHPNIIHIYEVFENREKMVLVMEFAAGGELYDYLSERKVLNEEEARRIFRQVATAVYYCHKHKICHRDLKLENILLDEEGNAKIADFGLSNVFDEKRLLATFCGSPLYASPEIVEGTPYHGPEVDCWSLGVLLYTLVYGSMPFDGSNFKRLVKQISQGDYYEPKKPSRASSLIREMLTVCPRKRATIEQICSHWWVNENDNMSCLELAEDLANQTPVRLDVLLSLTPVAVTADQLVVPSADGGNSAGKITAIPRSHSVGSIRDVVPNTEAERRILDMVAAGGEAALMPSPTRTITPAQSPIQTKRKLENTVSTDNAAGVTLKKKDKPESAPTLNEDHNTATTSLIEETTPMETDHTVSVKEHLPSSSIKPNSSRNFSAKDMEVMGDLFEQLIQDKSATTTNITDVANAAKHSSDDVIIIQTPGNNRVDTVEDSPEKTKGATKVIKKFVNKHKTADLVNVIGHIESEGSAKTTEPHTVASSLKSKVASETGGPSTTVGSPFVRKCSLQDEAPLNKFNAERRKSRILETAEKFQQMNAAPNTGVVASGEKPKKFVIPGVSVGNFKKEFERKASTSGASQGQQPTAGERRALEQVAAAAATTQEYEGDDVPTSYTPNESAGLNETTSIEASDSKASVSSFSLEDARRSMENSIALLRQAQTESSKDVNQLCAKTENIRVSDTKTPGAASERELKLKNARAIIGNAIQPVLRRPQPLPPLPYSSFFGHGNGGGGYAQMRAISGSFLGYSSPATDSREAANNLSMRNPKMPLLPTVTTQTPPPNANVALAAARQTLMGRLAAGGIGSFVHPNTLPSSMQSLHSLPSSEQGKDRQLKSLHNMYVPSSALSASSPLSSPLPLLSSLTQHPLSAMSFGSTAAATNANAKAVSTTTATTITNSNVINTNCTPKPFYNASQSPLWKLSVSQGAGDSPINTPAGTMKTSTASITLKSATLPRRRTTKTEIQLDIKPPIVEQPSMRFTTEMQHPVADLRSAPPREGPVPYSPIKTIVNPRASSLEPKEHVIPIQKPPSTYARTISNTTTRSGSLSRQSTNDSESDTTTTNMSQSTITGSSLPIKKSPREFIIPIAVEGGGFITPREGSIEPSESSHTTATTSSRSTFTRLRPTRRIGSILSDSGVDDSSPFQKLRTSSSNRDGDEDAHFTFNKLRSSRPVKKLSQENDSQSSGEEDDDDGFEILTAENLFSTLLQRVRALTNRMNVNNDITTGFPTSSRLLSDMRQAQSPFWNQEPFGRSKVSYTYSETIEKKQVRLNSAANSMGAPWRHSMSRDLGSDMDSMFSRTGATLPRGNKTAEIKKPYNSSPAGTNTGQEAEEPLDLADLDLSRLRLSKKDLETLSNIAPGLPKCFQEQLLAKLPPTQARKLSRTLSVQTNQNCSLIKIYKRSQSSGRNATSNDCQIESFNEVNVSGDYSEEKVAKKGNEIANRPNTNAENSNCEANIASLSALRSHSRSKSNDENGTESLRLLHNSDINDKYKYYSPYVIKTTKEMTHKNVENATSTETAACTSMLGRPPSGRLSPPPPAAAADGTVNVTRRPTQRRISRLLRPDFLEQPLEELSGEPTQTITDDVGQRANGSNTEHNSSSAVVETQTKLKSTHHVRNKSVDIFSERLPSNSILPPDSVKCNRRSLSRSRDMPEDKHELADKILQELQLLSSIRSQQEQSQENAVKEITTGHDNEMIKEKSTPTIKKIKKIKTKEKSTESSTDVDAKTSNTVIKKVKKIVKKSEALITPAAENAPTEFSETTNKTDLYSPKKVVSKLKRPKSYPMKESISSSNATEMCNTSLMAPCKVSASYAPITIDNGTEVCSSGVAETLNATNISARESRLLRPKSYPTSKLAAPKDVKKTIRNKITTIDETSPTAVFPKSDQSSKYLTNTAHIVEPTSIVAKKTVKVPKKSKLSQPTAISTPVTTSNTTSSTGDDSKESSPGQSSVQMKDKMCEKKPNKGLLYAIGQKFEKLRASATSSSCANIPVNKKSSPDNLSPEKISPKSSVVKKTKSLGNSATKTDQKSSANKAETCQDKTVAAESTGKPVKNDKRSRIDTMIRNLRERSIPRSQPILTTESNYIKRAISVEEMPGTFNRKSVNKVLGLFKRYEKDSSPGNRVRNTRSTSNIERQNSEASAVTTPIYQNADSILQLKGKSFKTNKSGGGLNNLTKTCKGGVDCKCDIMSAATAMTSTSACPDCIQLLETNPKLPVNESKTQEGNKERRKGLMLELMKPDKAQSTNLENIRIAKKYTAANDNEIYSNISPYNRSIQSSSGNGSSSVQTVENVYNNNSASIINNNNSSSLHTSQTSGYRTSSTHEINQNNNLLSPSFENIGTYSSDSRSYQEDCASTSTFLSPTEERELCFDTWSVCSEDNYRGQGATPSPTVSRLSRASQASSPTRRMGEISEPSESIVDRIKRRSFYCRFNEKKPKRTSSIVGPSAQREYYREQNAASKSRSSNKVTTGEREHSPDITQEFFRPLKLSPIGTELKPPVYRSSFSSSHDYSLAAGRPRKSLNDIRTPTSPSCLSERRYGSYGTPENELLSNSSILPSSRYKTSSSSTYDEATKLSTAPSSTYYNTYNPKRRYSFNTNGSVPSSGSVSNTTAHIEGYVTMGRRPIRAYDHRTMSLLDPPTSNSYRHEGNMSSLRDYTASLSRSNSRYRKSSTSRSPTNI